MKEDMYNEKQGIDSLHNKMQDIKDNIQNKMLGLEICMHDLRKDIGNDINNRKQEANWKINHNIILI